MRNRYGLDSSYIKKNINRFIRDINNYTPAEAARLLARLSKVADPEVVLKEKEFNL